MSCYYPMVALRLENINKYGEINPEKKGYRFLGKLKDIGTYEEVWKKYEEYDPILLPCGQCKGCRLDQSRKWADRMSLEFDHTKKAVFITLTYDDEHLPVNDNGLPTLVKSDMSTFMKDLRGNKYYEHKNVRFYGSGEYGEENFRPHMHICIFGLNLEDFTDERYFGEFHLPDWFIGRTDHKLYYAGQNKLHQPYWRSPHLDNVIWKKGRVCVSEFSWFTAAYVARYVRKKLNGPLGELYENLNIEPPFSLMSRRPGIGGFFVEDHPEKDFFEENIFSFKGREVPIPNYIFDKLEMIDYNRYNNLKEQRKKFAEDKILLKLQQTDLSYSDLLDLDSIHTENIYKVLKRDRVDNNLY